MAKRVDNNATMEVTESQLLDLRQTEAAARRPIPPPASTNRNDASVWAHRIVGAEEFAPPRAARAPRVRTWLVVLLVLVAVGAGGYFAYTRYFATKADPPTAAPAAAPVAPTAPAPAAPTPAKPAPKPAKKR